MAADYFDEALRHFPKGAVISTSGAGYEIVGLGVSYGEDAIVYRIRAGNTKRIARSHVNFAFTKLIATKSFTRADFAMLRGARASPCNFAVLGAFLERIAGAPKIRGAGYTIAGSS